MQLASSSLTGMVSGNANPHRTDADHLCRSHDRCSRRPHSALAALGLPCAMERGAPWGPLGLKPSWLMHMIGDDDDGDLDRDATMMAEHDGELMMAMIVALT